ncbi:hypothetical protein [Halomonas sp. YLGW01]|uniref:hypothetical protein n=1 Tax=Halomonas sp. YLGW01 TaxID=2773308 RepID=UPI0017854365|nr:hypothetical protein [Halomonas sp. YLGW01]
MSNEHFLPQEIIKQWQDAVMSIELSPNARQQLFSIVRYSLPPVSRSALEKAALVYVSDHDALSHHQIIELYSGNILSDSLPRSLKTQFSLYVSMTSLKHLGDISNPLAHLGRKLLNEWFATEHEDVKDTLYYEHLLKVRTVTEIVARSDWPTPHSFADPRSIIMSAAGSERLSYPIGQCFNKYELFTQIAEGKREAGVPKRHVSERRAGYREATQRDKWQDEHLSRLAKEMPSNGKRVEPEKADKQDGGDMPTEANQLGILPCIASSDDIDNEGDIVYQRRKASTLTPIDDHLLVRRLSRAASTSSIATHCDLQRLPHERVRSVLDTELPAELRTFTVLLLTTGMSVSRLARLRLAEEDFLQPGATLPGDDDPRVEPLNGTLSYRLSDGPSDCSASANRWISLSLPNVLVGSLSAAIEEASSTTISRSDHALEPDIVPRPLKSAAGRLNRFLHRLFSNKPGLTPTANRLRASSWLWRRPNARDDVAAQLLAGHLGLMLAAPAAYRQLDRAELQKVFDKTLQELGVALEPAGILVAPLSGVGITTLGSGVAIEAREFAPIFAKLRQQIFNTHRDFQSWYPSKPLPLEALHHISALTAGHTYLGWLLATGARPLGLSSRNRLSQGFLWMRDKASSQGDESRVIPLNKQIVDALHEHASWTASAIEWWTEQGGRIDDRRNHQRDTPSCLFPGRQQQTLVLREMSHADFKKTLELVPNLSDAEKCWPDNVTRHSLASWLRQYRPDGEVDGLLGHAHHGQAITAPWASAPIGAQKKLGEALAYWLKLTGYAPLPWQALRC